MRPYERLPGDPPTVRVYGATLEEMFEEAAYAVFDQGHRLDEIPGTYSRPVIAAGDTMAELLVAWIDELLAMSRVEGIVPSYFVVDRLEEGGVQGSAAGLPVGEAPRRGAAVTGLRPPPPLPVEIPDGWWADLILDVEPMMRLV
ncbi:MAG: archease [Acidimicrobiia bacterium]|nr:archease [Acidimicrobiia bacterium]